MNMMIGHVAGNRDANVTLTNAFANDVKYSADTATATYRIGNDKKVYLGASATFTEFETWCGAGASASSYEVLATVVDGTLTTGVTGAWQGLGTTREWSLQTKGGFAGLTSVPVTCTLNIEIRNAATQRRAVVATITLSAQKYA